MKTDLVDKNGDPIYVGDTLRTFDRTGKEWRGTVVIVDPNLVIRGRNPQYAFRSNYDTWLHPEHAQDWEIVKS